MVSGEIVKTITEDGLELQGFWSNQKSKVAVFHSHGTAGDFYTHKFIELEAEKLQKEGISFLSANNRGHDVYADIRKHGKDGKITWTQVGAAFEKFEDCIFDLKAWIDFLEKQGVTHIILQGHSLSQKLVYYQHIKKDPRVIGQIHLSPCNDAGFMYFTLGEKEYKKTNLMVQKMVLEGRGRELLPPKLTVVCPMAAIAYSGYLTEEGTGNIFPYHNSSSEKWKILKLIREPFLAIFGGADDFIKPSIAEAVKLFKENAISAKNIDVKIIENAPHSYVGYEEELVNIIVNWTKNLMQNQ